jgi:hypothetical protein
VPTSSKSLRTTICMVSEIDGSAGGVDLGVFSDIVDTGCELEAVVKNDDFKLSLVDLMETKQWERRRNNKELER